MQMKNHYFSPSLPHLVGAGLFPAPLSAAYKCKGELTRKLAFFFFALSFEGANKSQGDIYGIIKGNIDEPSSCNFSFQLRNPF